MSLMLSPSRIAVAARETDAPAVLVPAVPVPAVPADTFAVAEREPTPMGNAGIWCGTCEMWVNGQTQWQDHRVGKKHRKFTRMFFRNAAAVGAVI